MVDDCDTLSLWVVKESIKKNEFFRPLSFLPDCSNKCSCVFIKYKYPLILLLYQNIFFGKNILVDVGYQSGVSRFQGYNLNIFILEHLFRLIISGCVFTIRCSDMNSILINIRAVIQNDDCLMLGAFEMAV